MTAEVLPEEPPSSPAQKNLEVSTGNDVPQLMEQLQDELEVEQTGKSPEAPESMPEDPESTPEEGTTPISRVLLGDTLQEGLSPEVLQLVTGVNGICAGLTPEVKRLVHQMQQQQQSTANGYSNPSDLHIISQTKEPHKICNNNKRKHGEDDDRPPPCKFFRKYDHI